MERIFEGYRDRGEPAGQGVWDTAGHEQDVQQVGCSGCHGTQLDFFPPSLHPCSVGTSSLSPFNWWREVGASPSFSALSQVVDHLQSLYSNGLSLEIRHPFPCG